MEFILSIFSDDNVLKLEISHREKRKRKKEMREKSQNIAWKQNNMLLENQWVNDEWQPIPVFLSGKFMDKRA